MTKLNFGKLFKIWMFLSFDRTNEYNATVKYNTSLVGKERKDINLNRSHKH